MLNALLYYSETGERVDFCDPLILIKIVSMVVAHIHPIKLKQPKNERTLVKRDLSQLSS